MHLTMLNHSYLFRGLFCPLSVQTSLTQNCLKLSIFGFPYTSFLYLVMTLIIVWAWKSCFKVSLLSLGSSCPLQTILLSDLVICDSQLQIVVAVQHTFLKFEEAFQTTIIVSSWLQLLTGWAALPSENIS
jgi:hypothetical protein